MDLGAVGSWGALGCSSVSGAPAVSAGPLRVPRLSRLKTQQLGVICVSICETAAKAKVAGTRHAQTSLSFLPAPRPGTLPRAVPWTSRPCLEVSVYGDFWAGEPKPQAQEPRGGWPGSCPRPGRLGAAGGRAAGHAVPRGGKRPRDQTATPGHGGQTGVVAGRQCPPGPAGVGEGAQGAGRGPAPGGVSQGPGPPQAAQREGQGWP